MFRLIKLLISLGCFGSFVWWALTVPIGEKTLFGHVYAIGQSKESKELVRGTRQKVDHLKKQIASDNQLKPSESRAGRSVTAGPADEGPAAPPQETLTDQDRKDVRRLIDSARAKSSK